MTISHLLKDKENLRLLLIKAIDNKDISLAKPLIPLVQDPYLTYKWAHDLNQSLTSTEEDIIARDSLSSCLYAIYIDKPFPKGEPIIATQAKDAFVYVEHVLKHKWEMGEETISNDPYFALVYTEEILNDRFLLWEPKVIQYNYWLNQYTKFLKKINKLNEFLADYPSCLKK